MLKEVHVRRLRLLHWKKQKRYKKYIILFRLTILISITLCTHKIKKEKNCRYNLFLKNTLYYIKKMVSHKRWYKHNVSLRNINKWSSGGHCLLDICHNQKKYH